MKNRLFKVVIFLILVYGCYKAPVEQPYRTAELNNLIFQANKAFERGNIQSAQMLYQEALKKSRLIQDDNATAVILISLSRLYTSTGQIEMAEKCVETAESISHRVSLPESIMEEIIFERAKTGFLLDKNVEALLNSLINSSSTSMKIKSLNLLSRIRMKEQKYDEAEKLLNEALRINQNISKVEEANSLRLLGEIYCNKNRIIAERYLINALKIDKELALPEKIALDMEIIGICYKNLGEKQKAKDYLLRAVEIWRELGRKEEEMKIIGELKNL